MIAPCLNCEKRKLGCHSSCDDYISFKKERQRMIEYKQSYKQSHYDNYYYRNCKRDLKKSFGDSRYN